MTFINDDQAVIGGQRGYVRYPGEGLQGGDVDDAGGLGSAAAALAGFDPRKSRMRARHWSASA